MKLFISYSRDDKAWVYNLRDALRTEGDHDVWLDRSLVVGLDWWQTILEHIEASECFVYVLTPKAVESIYCRAELEYALVLNKPVLPLMLKPCEYPLALRHIQIQSIGDDMSMDKVLLRVERGLHAVQRGLDQGHYAPPASPPARLPLPTPEREPEQVSEVFALAEEAVAENNIPLAERLFKQVMVADPQGWGLAAAERLAEIRLERDRSRDYLAVVRMARNPATVRGARAAARTYIQKYGREYDPNEVLNELLLAAETRVDPPSSPAPSPTPTESNQERSELHRVLDSCLSLDELRQAVFDLGLDYDNLAGETKAAKARALILTLEHRGQLDRLVAWINENRDDIDTSPFWPGRVGPGSEPVKPDQPQTRAAQPRVEVVAPPATPQPSAPKLGDRMTDGDGVVMIYVPPGTFIMGSDDITDDEKPPHEITIAQGFWLDLTPVTNAMYDRFIKAGGYQNRDVWTTSGWNWVQANKKTGPKDYTGFTEPEQPRVGVTWYEADAYCRWRGGRLPTEAEWEWAARGPENRVYPWGNKFDEKWVIYSGNSSGKTAAVNAQTRREAASWVGALDMSGNVWEWVRDFAGSYTVLRGGSCNDSEGFLRAAIRQWADPSFEEDSYVGFRCARSA